MKIVKLNNQDLLIPKAIYEDSITGDVVIKISKDDKNYESYLEDYNKQEKFEKEIMQIK